MPDKGEPGSRWFLLAHLLLAAAGVMGVSVGASVSVQKVLGPIGVGAVWLWSAVFALGGVLGLIARLRRRYRAEVTAVTITSSAYALWGGMILYATPHWGAGAQIGVGLLASAAIMRGWARHRYHRLTTRARLIAETCRALTED